MAKLLDLTQVSRAKQYLEAGQLLASDYALTEGSTEWRNLAELLSPPSPSGPFPINAGAKPAISSQESSGNAASIAQEKVKPSGKDKRAKAESKN